MSIELAPNWKRSLALSCPLILASGAMTDAGVGAIVTAPLTLLPRPGGNLPRVVEVSGGMLLRTGGANPGLEKVIGSNGRAWAASVCPIIVALAAQGIEHWAQMAKRLERVPGVGGVELQLNPTLDAVDAIRATRAATELSILAKLDLENALDVAPGCIGAGANALVIGRAPRGMALVDRHPWYGRLYAPSVKPMALRVLADIAALNLGAPLIACGGVHSADDVRDYLSTGAVAVELDSAAWIDPQLPIHILQALRVLDSPLTP